MHALLIQKIWKSDNNSTSYSGTISEHRSQFSWFLTVFNALCFLASLELCVPFWWVVALVHTRLGLPVDLAGSQYQNQPPHLLHAASV